MNEFNENIYILINFLYCFLFININTINEFEMMNL